MCMTWNQSFAVKVLPCKASVKLLLNCCFINYHLSITLWPHFQYSPRWKPISLSSSQLLTFDPGSPYPSSLLLQDWTLSYSGSLPLFFILSNFWFVFSSAARCSYPTARQCQLPPSFPSGAGADMDVADQHSPPPCHKIRPGSRGLQFLWSKWMKQCLVGINLTSKPHKIATNRAP